MATASSAQLQAARRQRARRGRSAARAARSGSALPGISWERLARAAMLCVLVALLYLYLSAGLHMLSSWQQSRRDEAAVRVLEREHAALARERTVLLEPETVELEARRLGMVKPGEQSYLVGGLPGG